MALDTVKLNVPAKPQYARSMRMLAANLAVVAGLSIDDVEDVRMAAEEAFVYGSATQDDSIDITFSVDEHYLHMDFSLGAVQPVAEEYAEGSFSYAELILAAVSDEYTIDDDARVLTVVKRLGVDREFA